MTFDWAYLASLAVNQDFWQASALVAWLSILTWTIGCAFGFLVALARTAGPAWLQKLATTYIWFFRSLPLLVLLIFVYNLPQVAPALQPVLSNPFWSGLLALVISETAYLAEIHRGGLLAVDIGQHEAAHALGVRAFGKYRMIVVPQAIRVALPSLGNQFITIVKLTSLVSVISLAEVLLVGQRLYTRNFLVIETLVAVSAYYVMIVTIFTFVLGRAEKRLDVTRRGGAEVAPSTTAESVSTKANPLSTVVPMTNRRKLSDEVVVELRDVRKSFGTKTVLNEVSMQVRIGEVVSIIGPSGSGKTTLVRTINGLQDIDGGEIVFRGKPWIDNLQGSYSVTSSFYDEVTHIGMVFQSFNLFPHLTVLDNVLLGPRYHKLGGEEELRDSAMGNLRKVGMDAHAMKYPHQLSGGQKQRVAIARALAMKPKVMLFDEPTSALDPELVGEVLQAIELLATEGMTMIIVTHEMRFATRISDRIVMMESGRIVAYKTAAELASEPADSRLRKFITHAEGVA
ncbi:amino acid ABC transporter permease/ATP-binding protein [Burkholderia pyrrocinia]|nr:amino acid ABC transporter permease/ATP-binding protein [Burkholderia pyrrocinia]